MLYGFEMMGLNATVIHIRRSLLLVDEEIDDSYLMAFLLPTLMNKRERYRTHYYFRNNERAWAFLWACAQFLGDSEVLHSHWQLRHDWWLKFHCVPLSSAGNECRSKVLNLLKQLS